MRLVRLEVHCTSKAQACCPLPLRLSTKLCTLVCLASCHTYVLQLMKQMNYAQGFCGVMEDATDRSKAVDALPCPALRCLYPACPRSQSVIAQRCANVGLLVHLQEWRKLGFTSLEDFLVGFWEGLFLAPKDPNDLLAMIWTWQVWITSSRPVEKCAD